MAKSLSPQLVKTAEELRLDEAREKGVPWKQWGPYLRRTLVNLLISCGQ